MRGPQGEIVGIVIREQEAIAGSVELSAERARPTDFFQVTVRIANDTPFADPPRNDRDEALLQVAGLDAHDPRRSRRRVRLI